MTRTLFFSILLLLCGCVSFFFFFFEDYKQRNWREPKRIWISPPSTKSLSPNGLVTDTSDTKENNQQTTNQNWMALHFFNTNRLFNLKLLIPIFNSLRCWLLSINELWSYRLPLLIIKSNQLTLNSNYYGDDEFIWILNEWNLSARWSRW